MTDFSVSSIPSINAISLGDSQADDATAPQTADQATEATQPPTRGSSKPLMTSSSSDQAPPDTRQLSIPGAPA